MTQSVDRAVDILIACASQPRRLGELAGTLGVHRSTVLRHLQSMEQGHVVRRTVDGAWTIGFALAPAVLTVLLQDRIGVLARPMLRRLSIERGLDCRVAALVDFDLVYVGEALATAHAHPRLGSLAARDEAAHAAVHGVGPPGWREDVGISQREMRCLAVPIRDTSGRARGALSVAAPAGSMSAEQLRSHLPRLRESADAVAEALGSHGIATPQ